MEGIYKKILKTELKMDLAVWSLELGARKSHHQLSSKYRKGHLGRMNIISICGGDKSCLIQPDGDIKSVLGTANLELERNLCAETSAI